MENSQKIEFIASFKTNDQVKRILQLRDKMDEIIGKINFLVEKVGNKTPEVEELKRLTDIMN